jgi:hypothetical protein
MRWPVLEVLYGKGIVLPDKQRQTGHESAGRGQDEIDRLLRFENSACSSLTFGMKNLIKVSPVKVWGQV